MARPRETQWFVRHLNPHTNEVVARVIPEDSECMEVEDTKGNKFFAWRVPHHVIGQLRGFGSMDNIKFMVYSRQGSRGPVRRNEFTRPKSKNKGHAYEKAKKGLEKVAGVKQP